MVDFTDNHEIDPPAAPQTVTPMKVTAVSVIAIILGCIYLLGGIGGGVGLAVQTLAPGLFEADVDRDDPGLKMQAEFQQEITAMGKRFFWPYVVQTIAFTVVGVLLLIHSIQALRLDEADQYRRLATWLLIAIALEVLGAVMAGIYQYGQWSVVQGLTVPPGSGGQVKIFKNIMLFSTMFGIVITWVWLFGKLVYLTLGTMILKNHAVVLEPSEPHSFPSH